MWDKIQIAAYLGIAMLIILHLVFQRDERSRGVGIALNLGAAVCWGALGLVDHAHGRPFLEAVELTLAAVELLAIARLVTGDSDDPPSGPRRRREA